MKSEKNDRDNVRLIDASTLADPSLRYVMIDSSRDDEISLLDLWLVLVKRRSLFLALVLVCLLVGVFAALTLPEKYSYSTAIEIGGLTHDGQGKQVYVESPTSVLAKIKQSYIPFLIQAYLKTNPEFEGLPEINAKLEKNSNIIFLEVKGIEKYKKTYEQLLNSIVDSIKRDHKRVSLLKINDLELSKFKSNNRITILKNEEQLVLAQNKRLNEKELLLNKRIKDTRAQLKSLAKLKLKVASGAQNNDKVLSLLMVGNDIKALRSELAQMQEELEINLANSREEISIKLAKNLQMQAQHIMVVKRVEVELDNLLVTRAITEPLQSIKPVGVSKKLMVVIALLAGFFMAFFAVFFAEFLSKAQKYKAEL